MVKIKRFPNQYNLYIDNKFLGLGTLAKVKARLGKEIIRFSKNNHATFNPKIENVSGVNMRGIRRLR